MERVNEWLAKNVMNTCPCYVLLLLAACGVQGPEGQFMLSSHRSHGWLSLLTCNMSCDMIGHVEVD